MLPFRSVFLFLLVFFFIPEIVWGQERQKSIAELIYSRPGSWALPALIPFRQGKLWGYADSTGIIRIQPQFDFAGFFNNGLAPVKKGKRTEVINSKGKPLFNWKHSSVYVDKSGLLFVETDKGKKGVYNKDLKVILKPVYTAAQIIRRDKNNNPLILAWMDKRHLRKYRTIYKDGKQIERQFVFTGLFDKDGKAIVPLKYRSIELIGSNVIEAVAGYYNNFTYHYYTLEGQPITALDGFQISSYYSSYKHFSNGIGPIRKGYKFGFADSTGHIIIPMLYDDVRPFSDGLAGVRIKTKWGFINRQGEVVIPIIYDEIKPFKRGFAAVKLEGNFGLINKKGNAITDFIYDNFYDNSPGNFLYFYKNGKVALQGFRPKYPDTVYFDNGLPAPGEFHKGFGYVKKGEAVSFMDENGKLRIPFEYGYQGLSTIKDSLFAVKQGELWGVINLKNEVVVPFAFKRFTLVNPDRFIVLMQSWQGMYQMALINSQLQEIAPLQYQQISSPHHGKMFTLTDKEMGFIDLNGRELMKVPIPEGYTTHINWNNDTLTYGLREVFRLSDKQKDYIDWKGTRYFKD